MVFVASLRMKDMCYNEYVFLTRHVNYEQKKGIEDNTDTDEGE